MTEIEPTIENVREGDVVTIERGTPDEPGHETLAARVTEEREPVAYTCSLGWLRGRAMYEGWKIARITRPAPQIPDEPIPDDPGERFWARWRSADPREYIVTDGDRIVDLTDGGSWERDLFERRHSVVPAPEPETVPVPADLIREAEEWISGMASRSAVGILSRIVLAARDREGEL